MTRNKFKNTNPKSHESLTKWLISSFIEVFFEHYFPYIDVEIGNDPFLDKEFISKYEALKASLTGVIFLSLEIKLENQKYPIVKVAGMQFIAATIKTIIFMKVS